MNGRRIVKWLAVLAALFLVLFAVGLFVLHRWVGSSDFRDRAAREASALLGVPVTLGALQVDVFPVPAVAVDGVSVATRQPLTFARVEVRPDWRAALGGNPGIATLVVRDAVLPAQAVDALVAGLRKAADTPAADGKGNGKSPGTGGGTTRWLPHRTLLDGVTWVATTGARTTVDADATLAADGLPEVATLDITAGALQGTRVALGRGEGDVRWNLKVDIGGGTVQGPLRLQMPAPGATAEAGAVTTLAGELKIQGVEVSALTAPSRPLSGKLEASTTLSARGAGFTALADNLQSRTQFTVRDAQLNGLDLVKAVQTVGLSRGGSTRLDVLSGQLHTQGRAAHLEQLVATSGVLTARGDVSVSPSKALGGRVNVEIARGATGGLVGVPLEVGGTLEAPTVSLSRSGLLGAAIGTAIMPGVGTGAGAKLGDRIGNSLKGLFGK